MAVNTGITITLFATVPLSAQIGWRPTLIAYAAVSVALLAAWIFIGRDKAQFIRAKGSEVVKYMDVWRKTETWTVALCFAGPLAFNTWLPRYYIEAFGMTKAVASQYTGLFNLIGIPTAIVAGLFTQKLGLRRPFIIGAGVVMGFAAFGMIFFSNPILLMISATLLGRALFTYVAPLFTIPMELPGMTPQHVMLMMGTVFSFAYVFSSLSPVVVGLLGDVTGSFVPGLGVWAGFSWLLAVGGMMLPETGPGRKPKAKLEPAIA